MYAMNATNDFDDRAGPAATNGTTTLPAYPSGSQQQTQHRAEWIPSADRPLAGRLLATAKTGTMPARAETLTGAGSGSTASNRADGPDACSRPHDHRHVDGIIPNHPGAGSGSTASNCADGPDACSISVFVTALATAVGHTQFVIIMLLLAYIAMSGAMGGTSATARAAPIAHILNQLTNGSARYELALRLARGLIALDLALAIASAVAAAHAAIEEQERRTLEALDGLGDGGSPGEPEQHAAVEELERRAHEALNGLDGSAKRRHLRGDAPSETGFDALPTARRERELDVSLPAGDMPTKLASPLKPLAPIGPRAWAATPAGRPESSETYTCVFDQDVAGTPQGTSTSSAPQRHRRAPRGRRRLAAVVPYLLTRRDAPH